MRFSVTVSHLIKKLQISYKAKADQDREAQSEGLHQWMYYNLYICCLFEALLLKNKDGYCLLSLRSDRDNICLSERVLFPEAYLKNTSLRNHTSLWLHRTELSILWQWTAFINTLWRFSWTTIYLFFCPYLLVLSCNLHPLKTLSGIIFAQDIHSLDK